MISPNLFKEVFTPPEGDAGAHLSAEDLIAYEEESINDETRERVDYHLERCGECATIVERLIDARESEGRMPFPVFIPDLNEVFKRRQAVASEDLALAAASNTLPAKKRSQDLLPGFHVTASADPSSRMGSSVIQIDAPPQVDKRPFPVLAVWPTGQTAPCSFALRNGSWRATIPIPLLWPEAVELLNENKLRLVPVE